MGHGPAWSNCVFSFLLLILYRKVPELSKFSGRNLLFLQKTQVLWLILNNTIMFLYFLSIQQWACHLKCFCCSVHYFSQQCWCNIIFFTKIWQHFFKDAYFADELQMISFKRQYFSHNDQLSCAKYRTWLSSSLMFQHWCEEEIPSSFALAKWALIFPVFGNMISGMLCIYYSMCKNSWMK